MSAELPMKMSPTVEALWRKVYAKSRQIWVDKLDEYYDEDAKLTANAAVVGFFSYSKGVWTRRHHEAVGRMPDPGRTFELGDFYSIDTVDPFGNIVTHSLSVERGEKRPKLLWSHDLQACFVFPFMRDGACSLEVPAREAKLIAMWNKGRPARCASSVDYPLRSMLGVPSPGISISYRSDKFSHGKDMDYIHHFEGDVMVSQSSGSVPHAIMVRGGKLRVTEHGLDG